MMKSEIAFDAFDALGSSRSSHAIFCAAAAARGRRRTPATAACALQRRLPQVDGAARARLISLPLSVRARPSAATMTRAAIFAPLANATRNSCPAASGHSATAELLRSRILPSCDVTTM